MMSEIGAIEPLLEIEGLCVNIASRRGAVATNEKNLIFAVGHESATALPNPCQLWRIGPHRLDLPSG